MENGKSEGKLCENMILMGVAVMLNSLSKELGVGKIGNLKPIEVYKHIVDNG